MLREAALKPSGTKLPKAIRDKPTALYAHDTAGLAILGRLHDLIDVRLDYGPIRGAQDQNSERAAKQPSLRSHLLIVRDHGTEASGFDSGQQLPLRVPFQPSDPTLSTLWLCRWLARFSGTPSSRNTSRLWLMFVGLAVCKHFPDSGSTTRRRGKTFKGRRYGIIL
jgi:hypothetical protein